MDREEKLPKISLKTDMPDLSLVELTVDDAGVYYDLVDRNRDHLTKLGNYSELKDATLNTITQSLSDPTDKNAKFGIWLSSSLIGRVDLSPRKPGHFVIGYWLGNEYMGHGYATLACKAIIQYGEENLAATDIFAGVTKGNSKSEALLKRLGFNAIENKGTYTLFTLPLS